MVDKSPEEIQPDEKPEAESAAEESATEASDPPVMDEENLTPRQKRLRMREERRRQALEKKQRQEEKAEAQADEEEKVKSGQTGNRKRRDLLNAARQQTEYIRKESDQGAPVEGDDLLAEGVAQKMAHNRELVPAKQKNKNLTNAPANAVTPMTEAERDAEVAEIQRDLVRRRRLRWTYLWLRLAFFVALPTFLVSNYFYNYASPFYSTKAAFVIERGTNPSQVSGGLLSGTAFSTARESISVQEFLVSREAMRIIDEELGILEHFRLPQIDPIQRLERDESETAAYSIYRDRVLVSFDTTEGIIRLETIAATPDMALAMSHRLVELAEERVDNMASRVQADAVQAAQRAEDAASAEVARLREEVFLLQEELGILSAEDEIAIVQGQIVALTNQLEQKRLELAKLLQNARPNQAQVSVLETEIAFFEQRIEEYKNQLLRTDEDRQSLARLSARLQAAEADLALAIESRIFAVQGRALAEQDAAAQSLYLAEAVQAVRPLVPSYPRSFEYTVLAFVIFFAIYLLASLTVSILREQMSYGNFN